MTEVLSRTGLRVISSDLYNRGFGEHGHDFLTSNRRAANIITNPPFHSAEGFVAQCLKLAEAKFALLLRLAFLEGANRTRTIFHKHPPARVWVFSERITFYPKGAKMAGSGTTATRGLFGTGPTAGQRRSGGSSRVTRRPFQDAATSSLDLTFAADKA